ncbi:hypothetical protein O9929_14560 [Vibrio lentus]|nr:hypothetical protein [Vibrio lentus]
MTHITIYNDLIILSYSAIDTVTLNSWPKSPCGAIILNLPLIPLSKSLATNHWLKKGSALTPGRMATYCPPGQKNLFTSLTAAVALFIFTLGLLPRPQHTRCRFSLNCVLQFIAISNAHFTGEKVINPK